MLRRRLLACGFLGGGVILLLIFPLSPTPTMRTLSILVAPAAMLWGMTGVICPAAMLDPKLDLKQLDENPELLRNVAGNWPFWIGMLALLVGLGVGGFLVQTL
jgi:hypothetical protein